MTPENKHPRPNPDVIAQPMGDAIVLLNLKTNLFYELNETAARLWELLSSGVEIEQIENTMLDEFDVELEELQAEIEITLDTLHKEGLLDYV